jgi:hypothetical protein
MNMTTYIKVTYVAMDSDGTRPIMTADCFENLQAGLDDYYGCGGRGGECLGFTPHHSKYPDEYEGSFKYKTAMWHSDRDLEPTVYIDEVKVYCIDFWPHTKYEKES